MCRSEVAQLRQQIELELVSLRQGLYGIAQGTARHAFINARLERLGTCRNTLAREIGEAAADQVMCTLYIETMEHDEAAPVAS